MSNPPMESLRFDERGLIPAIIQDAETGTVLMLAYMNRESLTLTLETGQTHFWSRSRNKIWHKGETSANVQDVLKRQVRLRFRRIACHRQPARWCLPHG